MKTNTYNSSQWPDGPKTTKVTAVDGGIIRSGEVNGRGPEAEEKAREIAKEKVEKAKSFWN
jgi:hypothetical protein